MIVNVETIFKIDYDKFIDLIDQPELLMHVASPLMKFIPVGFKAFPKRWEEKTYPVKLKVFGVIPFGEHNIVIEKIKKDSLTEYVLRDNGFGKIIKRWDHWILIKRIGNNIQYIDRIDIKAGILTFFVYIFTNIFYRWRQMKWKKLIKYGFKGLQKDPN